MKKSRFSLLIFSVITLSLTLTACGDSSSASDTQKVTQQGTRQDNDTILAKIVSKATDSAAHWLTPTIVVLPKSNQALLYQLLKIGESFNAIVLTEIDFPENLAQKFPHLSSFQAYEIDLSEQDAKLWLKQQLLVVGTDKMLQKKRVSFVQTGAVIDALYTQGRQDANEETDLGAVIQNKAGEQFVSFKLWAPTARKVSVQLFDDNLTAIADGMLSMREDSHTGIWSVQAGQQASYAYYKYHVEVYHPASKQVQTLMVTDPYSLSLSVNSEYSQVVRLDDDITKPQSWDSHQVPTIKNIEDNVFYETHIRDFSANEQHLSSPKFKGKYQAFSEKNSDGIKHLKALRAAGLNNIHLLPTFDIATVNEDQSKHLDIDDTLGKLCTITPEISLCQQNDNEKQTIRSLLQSYNADDDKAQQLVSALRTYDNYNWGYDPFHYTVPEGSYALEPQGVSRLVEFREMVQSLHDLGFRVIMDVVYNHTHQAGLKPNSVLDKIVPNYYQRLHPISGAIEQSTCCDNTATERVMMAKLMTDSLVVWARDYKIDGFRFDLMGHQPKSAMLIARDAVRQVDADTYFYGEGWNFGEVASNSQFVQASQLELGGSEIGTFSDRLRDAVRGGGNNTRDSQGLGNGLLHFPNEKVTSQQSLDDYQLRINQLRIGLVGNLANFPVNNGGNLILGKDIPYGDQPTGYALDPADTINYVSKHDNQTLWDNSQYRLAYDVSTEDRVRMHNQSLSFVLFAQGIPFIHMGSEFMRSKSFLRDSYDYGDWFNRVDFSKQNNFYHVGLPPAEKDQDNWPLIKRVLVGHKGRDKVTAEQIQLASNIFIDMLAIRTSSPLFRLTNERDIIEKVSFLNTASMKETPDNGLVVMKIDDNIAEVVDENYQSLLVIFNSSAASQTFNYANNSQKSLGYQLHPIQQKGADEVVKNSKVTATGFIVPPLTSAVFVKPR
jgi:pullulanase-type alpha-1,6-glucosidase